MIRRPLMRARTAMAATSSLPTAVVDWDSPGARSQARIVAADRTAQAVRMARLSWRRSGLRVAVGWGMGSPHQVEEGEDDDPQQVDHVPVQDALFDQRGSALVGRGQFAEGDAEDEQAEEQVGEMDAGEDEVVAEELVGDRVALADLGVPFVRLDEGEQDTARSGRQQQPPGLAEFSVSGGDHG